MKFAYMYIIFTGLTLCAVGTFIIVQPEALTNYIHASVSDVALSELRTLYGGGILALGLFFINSLRHTHQLESALSLAVITFACLCFARGLGIVTEGAQAFDAALFTHAFISFMFGLYSLIKVRLYLSGDIHGPEHAVTHRNAFKLATQKA